MKNSLKCTKIIATVGPATNTYEILEKLILNGTNIFRLNFTHRKDSFEVFDQFFRIAKSLRKKYIFGIALDTQGPEIRIIGMKNNPIHIIKGQRLRLINNDFYDQKECEDTKHENYKVDHSLYFNFDNFKDVKVDFLCSIDDGFLKLKVLKKDQYSITCKALCDHILPPNKSFNFPGVAYKLSFVSKKDKEDIKYGILNSVDYIFTSFVSSKNNLTLIRNVVTAVINELNIEKLEQRAREDRKYRAIMNTVRRDYIQDESNINYPLFISKIESKEGYNNIDEIIDVSDGIMVARGNLGTELSLHQLFIAQKVICSKCVNKNKMFIIATQMIESMLNNSLPTRAEITDIGNAVLDGADCVMTSAETAVGKYPIECISMMCDVCNTSSSLIIYSIKAIELNRKFYIIENEGNLKTVLSKLKDYIEDQKHKKTRKIYMKKSAKAFVYIGDIKNDKNDLIEFRKYGPIILFTTDSEILEKFNIYKGLLPFAYKGYLLVNFKNFKNVFESIKRTCKEHFKISGEEICFLFSRKDLY